MTEVSHTELRDMAKQVARIDERTLFIQREISAVKDSIAAASRESVHRVEELETRVETLEHNQAVTTKLLKAVLAILSTLLTAGVSFGVWLVKVGLR